MMLSRLVQCLLAASTVWALWTLFRRWKGNKLLNKLSGPTSQSFALGNVTQFYDRKGATFHRKLALDYGTVFKLHGLFGQQLLYVSDPKALHTIIIKDEPIFEETSAFMETNKIIFGGGLGTTLGHEHRKQRKLLGPAFSIAHMHDMLPIFYQVVYRLRDAVASQVKDGDGDVDVLNWMGRTALELIGQAGLGYSFDPLIEDRQNEYGDALKDMFPALEELWILQYVSPYLSKLGPAWLRRLMVNAMPFKEVKRMKHTIDTMYVNSTEIYECKKVALQKGHEEIRQQVGEGKDLISVLMKANMVATDADRIRDTEVLAQLSTLTIAATDTTSNSLSRTLWLLAQHPDIQEKLRRELVEAGAALGMAYDALNRLPLLDAVCRETLRVYPPALNITRAPNKDTVLPLAEPVTLTDGTVINELPIRKGTGIVIGILGCNLNSALWGEDALEWKPERWLAPLPKSVTDAPIPGVYSNLMTFIGGKRACIGFKFSEMEMKVVLSVLLTSFKFALSDKPISWNVSGVWYPSVGDSDKPSMPMRVKPL